jgi:chaperonin GroES
MEAIAPELRVRMADDEDAARCGAVGVEQVTREDVPIHGLERRQLRSFHLTDGTLDLMVAADDKLPIKMLNDRLLVRVSKEDGERRSSGGILIPATAQMAKRLVWAEVVALGPNVRAAEVGDLVLFSAEDRYEVEVQGQDYIMLRERDIHAVAAERIEASTGLYL